MDKTLKALPPEHLAGCIALAPGDIFRVEDANELLVYVAQGTVWITEQEGDGDIVINAGDWWRLRRPGVAVAEALVPAVLMLTSPSADRPARAMATHDRPTLPAPRQRAPSAWGQAWDWVESWLQGPAGPAAHGAGRA